MGFTVAYFQIEEPCKARELLEFHIAERIRVRNQVTAICKELGVDEFFQSRVDGRLYGVKFPNGCVHPEWKTPDHKGCSFPKKNSSWAQRLSEFKGFEPMTDLIIEAFDVPTILTYKSKEDAEFAQGSTALGNPFSECGFVKISDNGPGFMWVPDVPAAVEFYEAQGYIVEEPAKSFKLEFPGCRRVHREVIEIAQKESELKKKVEAERKRLSERSAAMA